MAYVAKVELNDLKNNPLKQKGKKSKSDFKKNEKEKNKKSTNIDSPEKKIEAIDITSTDRVCTYNT